LDDRSRYVVGGAMLGAMLGALLGWGLARQFSVQQKSGGEDLAASSSLDMRRIFRLGVGVMGIVRQVLELE